MRNNNCFSYALFCFFLKCMYMYCVIDGYVYPYLSFLLHVIFCLFLVRNFAIVAIDFFFFFYSFCPVLNLELCGKVMHNMSLFMLEGIKSLKYMELQKVNAVIPIDVMWIKKTIIMDFLSKLHVSTLGTVILIINSIYLMRS